MSILGLICVVLALVATLLFVLFLCTYVPAIPMFLVDVFYPNRI